jgi:hypothetical protein
MVPIANFFTIDYNPYSNNAELVHHKNAIQLGESMVK